MNLKEDGELFWITGFPGAGKSTIARALQRQMKDAGEFPVLIDGDEFRELVGDNIGYSDEARRINAWRIARFCAYLSGQGLTVVCATVSLYEDVRSFLKTGIADYYEIYIRVDFETLQKRDQKQLYSRSQDGTEGNLVGVHQQAEIPANPSLIIDNSAEPADLAGMAQRMIALRGAR